MLYTRCPECETTFRITESALHQAQGQVRCGRCAHIFDARTSLTDRLPDPDDPADGQAAAIETPPTGTGTPPVETGTPPTPAATTASTDPTGGAPQAASAIDGHATAAPSLAAELEAAVAAANAEGADDDTDASTTAAPVMSADEIDAVLEYAAPAPQWLDDIEPLPAAPPSRLWLAGAAAAALLLGGQLVHHFRSALAGSPVFGGAVERTYALFGRSVVPNWDVTRYELVDWVAVETPGQSAAGRNLVIRSQLRNAAERAQPYPLVHLQLLDRWEDAVGARLFEPQEYATGIDANAMMSAGDTVDAELVIVDPGVDAYGFELAVCLETATGVVCDTDATFRRP